MLTRKRNAAALSIPQIRSNTKSAEINNDKKLKVQKKDEIEPARKSRRKKKAPADVPSPQIQKSRKRKTETNAPNKSKKLKTLKKDQKEHGKTYCWVCHKLAQDETCTCRRVYHKECLEKTSKAFENNKCPECQLKSVNGTELTRPFIDGLKVYLESATKWITDKHKDKMSWPLNSDHVPELDVETLIKKVQCNSYKTTAEFYADVKWFYHDCCVLYGEHSKHSKDMKKIVKEFKEELFDMEACPECYYYLYIQKSDDSDDEDCEKSGNSINEKFFVRLCNPPHDIVWAKVAGYSHFPAKCLKVINGKARVRFFGKHEKSDIPINTIFHISQEHPVYEYRNITNVETRTSLEYTYAKRELLEYISVYKEHVGDFQFFGFRVFYDPENANSNAKEKIQEPGLSALTTPSPALISTPTNFKTQVTTIPSSSNNMPVNMEFCADARTPEIQPGLFAFTTPSPALISTPRNFETQVTTIPSSSNNTPINMEFCADARTPEIQPGLFALTTPSPALISTPRNFETQVTTIPSSSNNTPINMEFCADACTPEIPASASCVQRRENTTGQNTPLENPSIPVANSNTAVTCIPAVSATGSISNIPAYGMATFNGIQIKEEFEPINLMQLFGSTLTLSNGGNTSSAESLLSTIIENLNSHNNSEKTISPSILSPNLSFIKKEYDDCLPSTSKVHQPEIQTITDSSENTSNQYQQQVSTDPSTEPVTTGEQNLPEPQVTSSASNNVLAEIDLTEDDDSTDQPNDTAQPTLSNLFEKDPQMQQFFVRTNQVVGSFLTRLCEEFYKLKTPEPNQMCKDLTKKLDETEKKFQEETEKLRDQIKHLEKNLATEK